MCCRRQPRRSWKPWRQWKLHTTCLRRARPERPPARAVGRGPHPGLAPSRQGFPPIAANNHSKPLLCYRAHIDRKHNLGSLCPPMGHVYHLWHMRVVFCNQSRALCMWRTMSSCSKWSRHGGSSRCGLSCWTSPCPRMTRLPGAWACQVNPSTATPACMLSQRDSSCCACLHCMRPLQSLCIAAFPSSLIQPTGRAEQALQNIYYSG